MKVLKKVYLKNKNGITLISLIVTIIIILILVTVSIKILLGDNGLLRKVFNIKEENRIGAIVEEWDMLKSEISMSKITGDIDITKDEIASRLSNVGMTSSEIDTLIRQESSIVLNSKTILNYSDLGLETTEVVSLSGKSALFIGDSVAYGQGNDGKAWSYYINREYNLSNCTNVAALGASWTYNSTTSTMRIINQYKDNLENYDFIILEGGINDLTNGSTWGEVSDSKTIVPDSQIITEAMDEAFSKAIKKWPNSRIGYILLYNTQDSGRANHSTQLDEYHNLIISICNKWNIPVFDMYSGKVIENNVEVTFDELLDVHNTTYLEDRLHLNGAGYEKTYSYIAEWMQRLPKINNINQEDEESFIAFGNLSKISNNRYRVEPSLRIGDIVNFVSEDLWNTYKFAIGPGTGNEIATSWIGDTYQYGAYTIQKDGDYTIMVAKQDESELTTEDLEVLASNFGKTHKDCPNIPFIAFGTLSKLSNIRYCVESTLKAGDIVNFASDDLWNTYKFAIGHGTGRGLETSWIGGTYQSGAYTIPEDGDYTIMVARQDNAVFTTEDLEVLASKLGIKKN